MMAKMTWNGVPIRTDAVFPPIPIRSCDYVATLGDFDEGVPYEYGESPEIAAMNLVDRLYGEGL